MEILFDTILYHSTTTYFYAIGRLKDFESSYLWLNSKQLFWDCKCTSILKTVFKTIYAITDTFYFKRIYWSTININKIRIVLKKIGNSSWSLFEVYFSYIVDFIAKNRTKIKWKCVEFGILRVYFNKVMGIKFKHWMSRVPTSRTNQICYQNSDCMTRFEEI